MRNVFTVATFEIRTLLSKPSFWMLTIFFPLFILVLTFGSQFLADNGRGNAEERQESVEPTATTYVDLSGLIETLPSDIPAETVQAYPSEAAAMSALEAGEIAEYYVIAVDYVESGLITLVQRDYQPMAVTNQGLLQTILNYNLIGADDSRWALVSDPLREMQQSPLTVPTTENADAGPTVMTPPASIVAIVATMLLFFVLVMSSGYMLRSVSREKENRTVEVLLLSLRPRELMLGKILGLCVVALVQMSLWLTASLLFAEQSSTLLDTAVSLQLPPGFIAWTMVYVLLGFILYASLMGALGALAPTSREANQFSFAVLLPLIIPVWLNGFIANAPDSTLAVTLSLFPLTSPPSMIARLAATDVPLWQPVVGVAALAITTYLAILLAARFFRADTLLSSSSLNWQSLFRAVRS
ncbi:ABC transporter permease subunit [bacterium]|nr:ABC transporter permease subunit [bacterium]